MNTSGTRGSRGGVDLGQTERGSHPITKACTSECISQKHSREHHDTPQSSLLYHAMGLIADRQDLVRTWKTCGEHQRNSGPSAATQNVLQTSAAQHRYIIPVLAYHQGAWGLLAVAEVWREVDEALDAFCVALCPEDLRGCVSHDRSLWRELPLPRGNGGLGITHVATEAPIMAAGVWPRQQAVAASARRDLVAVAYRLTTGALVRTPWAHVTTSPWRRTTRPTPCICAPRPATVAIGAASNRTPCRVVRARVRGGPVDAGHLH